MQTRIQGGHLSSVDKADPNVTAYLNAVIAVRRLEGELADARARADAFAAELDTHGEARGRLGRVARELGVEEQSVKNQRQRGKNPRRAAPKGITRRVLTNAEYDTALGRADAEARHQVPGPTLDAIACGVLAAVGLLAPPPEPEDDGTCTAQYPDPEGHWRQCQMEPHHAERHDAGGRGWDDDSPNAVPARP